MKRPPTPTADAKARWQELGEREIAQFIGEISNLRSLVQFLPTVPGFRKMSKAGIERQKQELARRLSGRSKGKSDPPDRDCRAFFAIWRGWVKEKLGEPKVIEAAIDAIEEAFGAPESAEKEKDLKNAIVALFMSLSKNSADGKCSREDIERAFEFSPFSESTHLRSAIGAARTSAEIERATELEGIPNRLRQDEDEISSMKSQLQELAKKADRLGSAVDSWPVQRVGLLSTIDGLKASLERRMDDLEAHGISNATPHREETESEVQVAVKSLEVRFSELSEKVVALVSASGVDSEGYARASSRIDDLERRITTNDRQAIEHLAAKLNKLEERLDKEVRLASTADPLILARLDEIEEALTAKAQPVELSYETKNLLQTNRNRESSSVRVESIVHSRKAVVMSAASFDEATAPLVSTFQDMGLKASAAKLLAEDVCAAVFIGQVVFFKGAYATEAARSCAGALCSGSAYRVSLPVGLQSGEDLRSALENEIRVEDELVVAVTIEGVNLAAFEILKDVLADLANHGSRNGTGQIMVLGTIAQGVASLPIDPSYLELGPIIDLDCFDWRSSRPNQTENKLVALSVAMARSLRASLNGKSADAEEAQRLVRSFVSRRNPRIEHVVLSAYAALVACRKDKEMPTPLQSLVYGWLAPYWATHRVSKSDVDSEVDGGKCDAATPDPRIKLLLDDFDATRLPGRSP